MSKLRRTRNSDIAGDIKPPYEVELIVARFAEGAQGSRLAHAAGKVKGGHNFNTCCRLTTATIDMQRYNAPVGVPTCLQCATCRGCYCCRPGHIREETVRMGKWETKDGRRLYPFEMDATHLMNSIAKLRRDEKHFKQDWLEWLEVLEVEAGLRYLL